MAGRTGRKRRGMLLSYELLWVLPIMGGVFFAVVEFGMIWSAQHGLTAASQLGARVASLPAESSQARELAVREAVDLALAHSPLSGAYELDLWVGESSGDCVVVELRAPMEAAAPDLLAATGLSLRGRQLIAHSVARRE